MAGFGAKVKLTVNKSSAAKSAFQTEINQMMKEIKISKINISQSFNVTQRDVNRIAKDISGQLAKTTIQIRKIDASPAIKGVKKQLESMFSALSLNNGVNITGLKEFVDTDGMKEIASDIQGALTTLNNVSSAVNSKFKNAVSAGSEYKEIGAELTALMPRLNEYNAKVAQARTIGSVTTPDDIANIQAEGVVLAAEISQIQERIKLISQGKSTSTDANNTEEASAKRVLAVYKKLAAIKRNNTRIEGTDIGDEVDVMMSQISSATSVSIEEVQNLEKQTAELEQRMISTGKTGKSVLDRIGAAYKKFGGWSIVTRSLTAAYRVIKDMISNVRELDAAMTELKKVTNETDSTYEKFLNNSVDRAKKLGATLADTVNATADFARLGYSLDEASEIADAAIVYKNVGDGIENINDASESIISTMQAFGVEAKDVMTIVDRFNKVGNEFPITSTGIGEGLLNSAAALESANNTLDQSIGLITAANATIQDASKVGTALKTVSMYLRAAKTEAEEAGESTEGMANSVSELQSELLSLTGGKVNIIADNGDFKSTYEILRDLAEVWHEISDISQANILEMIGGKRNSNVVSALLENFDIAEEVIQATANSAGSALAENEKYLDSINGKLSVFKATFEELSSNFIDSEFVKDVIEAGTGLLGFFNNISAFMEQLGGFGDLLIALVPLTASLLNARKITDLVTGLKLFQGIKSTFQGIPQVIDNAGNYLGQFIAQLIFGVKPMKAFGNTMKNLWGNMSGFSKFTVIVLAITAVVKIIDALVVTVDEAGEKLAEAKSEYQSITNEIKSLNDELNTTNERITELQSKGKLSFTEQEELDNLQRQNNELERSIVLAKTKQDIASREQSISLKNFVDKFQNQKLTPVLVEYEYGGLTRGDYQWMSDSEALPILYQRYSEQKQEGNEDGALKTYQKISDIIGTVITQAEGLEYINNPLTLSDEEHNKQLDYLNDIIDRYNIVMGMSDSKNFALNRLTTETFADEMYELRQLGAKDGVTSEMLEDDKYNAFINKAIELGVVTDDGAESLEFLALYFNSIGDAADESASSISKLTSKTKDYNSVANSFASMSDEFDMLDKIYADIKDKEDFDFTSVLGNADFNAAFENLDGYDDFVKTITSNSSNIDACQESFNKLVTSYLNSSDAIKNVTAETKDMAIAFLEQNGVANAASIIEEKLQIDAIKNAYATNEWTEATYEQINSEYQLATAGSVTHVALAQLLLSKQSLQANPLDLTKDIETIIGLANAARAGQAEIAALEKASATIAKYKTHDWGRNSSDENIELVKAYNEAIKIQDAINNGTYNFNFQPIKLEDIVTYSGGAATKKASKDADNWFEKQYKKYNHLLEMNQAETKDYLTWLNSAYQKAYKEGIIKLDDYYKYQEEVYTGLQDLFKEYLNDIEHEISMRENYDGESKKIITLYKKMIADIEKEVAKARKQGLTDEDDYVQELQSKWQDYKDAIKEIQDETTENAKDALDELVEYRIDMIKQDLEDEKDALDKKLDYLKEFYDKQKEMLQDQYDEEKYLEEQAEKRKSVSDIQSELAMLELDDSAWAQKRKLELQEELTEAQKELTNFEDEHALDMALDALDNAYNAQEEQINAEMEALEDKLNSPEMLYNQALKEIQNNTKSLYQEMVKYNNLYGSGNEEDVKETYEEAYKTLLAYKQIYGKDYEGVVLTNATGYSSNTGTWDKQPVANSANKTTVSSSSSNKGSSSSSKPTFSKGSTVTVEKSATHFGSKSGGVKMSSSVPGGKYTVYNTSGNQVLIGRNGVYTGWVNKKDIVGYATGTSNARAGLARIFENGYEQIFTSTDGNRYKLFNAGDKVLNAKATDFLYNFANSGGLLVKQMLANAIPNLMNKTAEAVDIHMGDIIIQGNADNRTVSEIRRAQRENIDYILKEFTRLNK